MGLASNPQRNSSIPELPAGDIHLAVNKKQRKRERVTSLDCSRERKWQMECAACWENLPSVTNGRSSPLTCLSFSQRQSKTTVGTQHWMINPHVCIPRRARNYHEGNFSVGWLHFRTNDLLHFLRFLVAQEHLSAEKASVPFLRS